MILLALAQSVALTGGIVHSMVPGRPDGPATILIEKDRITAVGPDVAIPSDARTIDVAGKHVIPGLVDGLVNVDADHDRLYLSSGVTLVRDVGNDLTQVLAERDSAARDRNPGPAIWSSGGVLDGPHPATTAAVLLATPEDADSKLPRLFDLDLDFLSFHLGLPKAAWKRTIEIAHAKGLQVWGPVIREGTLAEAVQAGQDGLYHLDGFLPPGVGWDKATKADLAPAVALVAGSKIAVTPGLAVYAQRLVAPKEHPPELAYLGPIYVTAWLLDAEQRKATFAQHPELLKSGLRALDAQSALVKTLYDKGVVLVPGSAAPNPWLFPGEALIDELELWSRAGIPTAAILRMATAGAAQAIGAGRLRGTIEPGKVADLVVLDSDPFADVSNLRSVAVVVLRGDPLDRATLEKLRAALAETQKKRQENAFKPLAIEAPKPPIGDVLLRGTVETRALGQRVSGESFVVTRTSDGGTVYQGHMLTLGSATTADTEVTFAQTISAEHDLVAFDVDVVTGPRTVTLSGTRSGSTLNIERRINGQFVDGLPVRDRVALVDVGSVSTELVLGHQRGEGSFKVVYFEDFEPAVATWELRLDKDGTHLVRTQAGAIKIRFDAAGAPESALREQGRGILEMKTLSEDASGGGLPPLPAKRAAPPAAKTAPPAKKD